jgi:tRNA-binding EMAP/Myf-like protein
VVAEALAARVVAEHPHPNADRLRIAVVEAGARRWRVVYGGTRRLTVGDVVPVALPGTKLTAASGLRLPPLRIRNFRGVRSEAMLCSSDELGWTVGGLDEVLLLGDEHPVGESVRGTAAFHWLYGAGREQAKPFRRLYLNEPVGVFEAFDEPPTFGPLPPAVDGDSEERVCEPSAPDPTRGWLSRLIDRWTGRTP